MNTITLNDNVRALAKSNPTALLTVIGYYTTAGKVNDIDVEAFQRHVTHAQNQVAMMADHKREDFDSDLAFNDQVNTLTIMREMRLGMNHPFDADNIPDMIEEMYERMRTYPEVKAARKALSQTTKDMEAAFMNKAKAELY